MLCFLGGHTEERRNPGAVLQGVGGESLAPSSEGGSVGLQVGGVVDVEVMPVVKEVPLGRLGEGSGAVGLYLPEPSDSPTPCPGKGVDLTLSDALGQAAFFHTQAGPSCQFASLDLAACSTPMRSSKMYTDRLVMVA